MKYTLAYGESAAQLEEDVAGYIALNYKPMGGIAIVAHRFERGEIEREYYQAMVLLE